MRASTPSLDGALRSRLRLGRRLYFVVFETSLDGLVVLPRGKRYLPMLAGMLADLLLVAALTLVGAATLRPDGSASGAGAICLALAFATLVRFVWQFNFHLRTDLYHVVVVLLGCHDLHEAARRIMLNRFRRLVGRPTVEESGLHPSDHVVGRWYSWLLLAGYTFSIGTLAFVGFPVLWRSLSIAVSRFGREAHPWHQVVDSVVFLSIIGSQFLTVAFLAIRSRRRRASASISHLTS